MVEKMDIINSKTRTLIQVGDFGSHISKGTDKTEKDDAEGKEANELRK